MLSVLADSGLTILYYTGMLGSTAARAGFIIWVRVC